MVKFPFNLEPKVALKYLRNKGFKLSFDYDELQKTAHHKSFTVAKITRMDILNDVFNSMHKAMKSGQSFKDFQKGLKPTLQKKGWWGLKDIVNPKTGEVKTINIGANRLRNIYHTNMRVAYSQQRYKQQMLLPISKYLRYVSAFLENSRVDHKAAHDTVLPRDHIYWSTNYPLNGWGCVCKTEALSLKEIKKRGLKISETAPNVASKDWTYHVGEPSSIGKLNKIDLDKSLKNLPSVKSIKRADYKNLSEQELEKKFYKKLNIEEGGLFIDKVNDPMTIDKALFMSASGHSKIKKQDRHLYLDEIAQTIKDPDEIYLYFNEDKQTLEKKMFRYYKGEGGGKRGLQVVFEYLKDKTQGVTAYFIKDTKQVEKRRYEKLIYEKGQE